MRQRDSLAPLEPSVQSSERLNCSQIIERIRDFYMAPVIRFVYNTISYLAFLSIFSYLLLFELKHNITVIEYIVVAWMITLLLEEVKQATLSGISFSTYISDSWNKLDCIAVGLFVIGFALRMASLLRERPQLESMSLHDYNIVLTDDLFITARICYAFSLFAFFIRLMYIFSFHIALGPKLIMIGKMVINDLVPFMVILLVFILGYGVAAQSIAYPIGYYTPGTDFNKTSPDKMSQVQVFVHFLTRAYFQMFGDFGLDAIQAEDADCKDEGKCPHWTSQWLVPIMLGIYVLLTNILMFNLLIAMFSSTYESINQFSALHWNYQRYSMIKEYIERSPLAPPLIIFWHCYEMIFYIRLRYRGQRRSDLADPLKLSYKGNAKKERELIKWEHMKAMDYLRGGQETHHKKAGTGRDGKSIIVRTGGGAGQQLAAAGAAAAGGMSSAAMDMAKQMSDATSGIGMELERRFKTVDTQLQRIGADFESKISDIGHSVQAVQQLLHNLHAAQAKLLQQMEQQQQQQQLGLESAMRTAAADALAAAPSWFDEATTRAAAAALRDTPVAIRDIGSPVMQRLRTAAAAADLSPPHPPSPPPPPPRMEEEEEGEEEEEEGSDDSEQSLRPRVDDPTTGRVIQHHSCGHRLWRMAPFNFEQYPGMRMNVPPDRIPWEVEYRDYFAYDASDEVLVFPSTEARDEFSITSRITSFNQFDQSCRLRRQSLMGRYRLDPSSNTPLNPMGRTGLKGKGLLPRWGPNHAVVVIVTRWNRAPSGAVIHRLGRPILQVLALFRHKQFCLPWLLTDHLAGCDLDDCTVQIIKYWISSQLKLLMQRRNARQEISAVQRGRAEQAIRHSAANLIYKGHLDDHLNADNAWIEAVAVNIHEPDGWRFSDSLLKAFAESECDEQVKWMEVAYSTALRSSHCDLLKTVASQHNAYF